MAICSFGRHFFAARPLVCCLCVAPPPLRFMVYWLKLPFRRAIHRRSLAWAHTFAKSFRMETTLIYLMNKYSVCVATLFVHCLRVRSQSVGLVQAGPFSFTINTRPYYWDRLLTRHPCRALRTPRATTFHGRASFGGAKRGNSVYRLNENTIHLKEFFPLSFARPSRG